MIKSALLAALVLLAVPATAYLTPSYGVPETARAQFGLREGIWLASVDRREDHAEFDRLYGKMHLVIVAVDTFAGASRPYFLPRNREKAARVERALKSRYPIARTFSLYDEFATRDRLRALFQTDLPDAVAADDLVIVYIAMPARSGSRNAPDLIPFDGNWPVKATLPLKEMYDFSRDLPAANALFIFDLCTEQELAWDRPKIPFLFPWTELSYLRETLSKRNRLFLLASDECPHRDDVAAGAQIFSTVLAKALTEEDEFARATDFIFQLRQKVIDEGSRRGIPVRPVWTVREGADIYFVPDLTVRSSRIDRRRARIRERIDELTTSLQSPYMRADRLLLDRTRGEIEELQNEMEIIWREKTSIDGLTRARVDELEKIRARKSRPLTPSGPSKNN